MSVWLTKQVMMIAALVALVALVVFAGPAMCSKMRSQEAQSRMDAEQSQAQSNSSGDAVNTVAKSGEDAAKSEDLTRSNERDIRNAEGANTRIGAGVDVAGRRSLCKRPAYRDDPKCRVFNPASR